MGYRFIFVLMQWIPAKVRGGVIIHHTLSCVIAFDLTLHCLLILLCQGKIITNKHSSSTSAFPWSIECNLFALWQANLLFGLPDAPVNHKFSKRSMPGPQMMYCCCHKVSGWLKKRQWVSDPNGCLHFFASIFWKVDVYCKPDNFSRWTFTECLPNDM